MTAQPDGATILAQYRLILGDPKAHLDPTEVGSVTRAAARLAYAEARRNLVLARERDVLAQGPDDMMNVRLLWTMIDFYQEHGPKTALGKEALRLIPISQRYCLRSDKYRYSKLMRYRREVEATRHSALKAWIRITTKAPASEPAEGGVKLKIPKRSQGK